MASQHPENESKVIHSISDIKISPAGISVTKKLKNIISGALKSPIGEFPLTEFYYRLTEELLEIYDRHTAFLVAIGIKNFTVEELQWIIDNLPIFNDSDDYQDITMLKLDFRPWKNQGWMVFRISGSNNTLIGYIRRILPHLSPDCIEIPLTENEDDPKPDYYFQDRCDNVVVSKWERYLIDKFILGTIGDINVTDIEAIPSSLDLMVGDITIVEGRVRPLNATYRGVLYSSDDNNVAYVEDNGAVTAIGEGNCNITVRSEQLTVDGSSSRASVNVPVTVSQIWEFVNQYFDITFDPIVGSKIIIGMDPNMLIRDFLNSFTNRKDYIRIFTQFDYEITDDLDEFVGTGMYATLNINSEVIDRVTIIVRGDLNGDGYANTGDLTVMNQHIFGNILLNGPFFKAGDINNDGVVDELDRARLVDYINNGTPLN